MVRRSALRPLPTPVGLARKRGREGSLPPKTTGGPRTTGLPGALTKNTGDGAWLFDNRIDKGRVGES